MITDKEVTRIWKITITFVIMWFDIAFREIFQSTIFHWGFGSRNACNNYFKAKDSLTANGSKGVGRFES